MEEPLLEKSAGARMASTWLSHQSRWIRANCLAFFGRTKEGRRQAWFD